MERQSVSSSAIISMGFESYDPEEEDSSTGDLEIEFKDGRVYTYSSVPYRVWLDFSQAPSIGRYFNTSIRNTYSYSQ